MKTILRIDAVPRNANAVCTNMADRFLAAQSSTHIICRDLTKTPMPRLNGVTGGMVLDQSQILQAEVNASDMIVIASELHALGLSTSLNGWVEQLSAHPGLFDRAKRAGCKVVLLLSMCDRHGPVAHGAVNRMRAALAEQGLIDVFFMAEDAQANTHARLSERAAVKAQ